MSKEQHFIQALRHGDLVNRFNPILFKGQVLAYSLYPHMWMRPRGDIDMLVDRRDHESLVEALRALGYRKANSVGGDLVMPQVAMYPEDDGIGPVWDIHWRFSNRPAFASTLTFSELSETTIKVRVGDVVFSAPNPVDSLLIACLHLIGHHCNDIRLIWLYDIHLLVESLSDTGYEEFLGKVARSPEVQSACHTALGLAERYLPTPRTGELCRVLDPPAGRRWTMRRSYGTRLIDDARAVRKADRLRFVRQHMLPSADYMMKRFGLKYRWQLPIWYMVRLGRAVPKLFKRS